MKDSRFLLVMACPVLLMLLLSKGCFTARYHPESMLSGGWFLLVGMLACVLILARRKL